MSLAFVDPEQPSVLRELGPPPTLPHHVTIIFIVVGVISLALPFVVWGCIALVPCRRPRREHRKREKSRGWHGWEGAKHDYTWIFWDPDGQGRHEYEQQRERHRLRRMIPDWMKSYPESSAVGGTSKHVDVEAHVDIEMPTHPRRCDHTGTTYNASSDVDPLDSNASIGNAVDPLDSARTVGRNNAMRVDGASDAIPTHPLEDLDEEPSRLSAEALQHPTSTPAPPPASHSSDKDNQAMSQGREHLHYPSATVRVKSLPLLTSIEQGTT